MRFYQAHTATKLIWLLLSLLLWAGIAAPSVAATAASTFDLSGTVRVRQEMLEGQYRPGFDAQDDMLAVRSTLAALWKGDGWQLGGEVVDSRAYGTDADSVLTANEVNALEVVQAYVVRDFAAPFGEGTSATLQAGRFAMNLGSRRLVASDDFRNTPQSYTGLRTDLRLAAKRQLTFFYVLPQQRRPDDFASLRDNEVSFDHEGFDLQLMGVVASQAGLRPGVTGELSYVRLHEDDYGVRATRNRHLHSLSARLIRDAVIGVTDFEVEGIVQRGRIRSSAAPAATGLDVNAYFVHAEIGHTWGLALKPHLSLEFDHASGDGPGADYQRFDSLYGMRRADLAPSGIYGALGRTNLQAIGLRLEMVPSARIDLFATYKALWAADRHDSFSTSGIRDVTGASGRFAGQQFDGRLRYWLIPQKLRAEINTVWLRRSGLLKRAPNASPHGNTKFVAASVLLSF